MDLVGKYGPEEELTLDMSLYTPDMGQTKNINIWRNLDMVHLYFQHCLHLLEKRKNNSTNFKLI